MPTHLFQLLKHGAKKITSVPASLALVVQCLALVSVLTFSVLISLLVTACFGAELRFNFLILTLMQALFAVIFSRFFAMPIWWRWIHFCFPLAVWMMSNWHLSNEIYLAGFLISLSLFWTTFRTQVPFYPSRPIVWQHVATLMPNNQSKTIRMIDIGSGLGDMSIYIAKQRPDARVEGMEIAPLPWLISYLRARIMRSAATFKLGDYQRLDFANYDVIFAYLSPVAMLDLWRKSQVEMQKGSLLISYEFEIPNVTPTFSISTGDRSPMLYVWQIDKP